MEVEGCGLSCDVNIPRDAEFQIPNRDWWTKGAPQGLTKRDLRVAATNRKTRENDGFYASGELPGFLGACMR
jgi:hypothetical protein